MKSNIAPSQLDADLSADRPDQLECLRIALGQVLNDAPLWPCVAIPWFYLKYPIHLLQREFLNFLPTDGAHPIFLQKSEATSGRGGRRWARLWMRRVRCMMYGCYLVLSLLLLRFRYRREAKVFHGQHFDIIAKTWVFDPIELQNERDFYYGDFACRLKERGLKVLTLFGDAEGAWWTWRRKKNITSPSSDRLMEQCLIPILAPLRLAWRQVVASLFLESRRRHQQDPFFRRLYGEASEASLGVPVTDNSLYYWIGREAVRRFRPRAVVTLYEANSWERCMYWGVKDADEQCRTVGYQHTVIIPYSRSLMIPHDNGDKRLQPDIVLCLGERTRDLMRKGHERCGVNLIPFGSFRHRHPIPVEKPPCPQRKVVLVTPVGMASEAISLFRVGMLAAEALPDYRFIFRCHPALPFASVQTEIGFNAEKFSNIEVSTHASIEDDFSRASVLLYRGSSAVLYSIFHGIVPIYLHDGGLREDPLMALTTWRRVVTSNNDLVKVLRLYAEESPQGLREQWKCALDYVKSYTLPVTSESLDRFLQAI